MNRRRDRRVDKADPEQRRDRGNNQHRLGRDADDLDDLRLTTLEMARFAARGYLEFPALIEADVGQAYVADVRAGRLPQVPAGTVLAAAYPPSSPVHQFAQHPNVAAIIESLVGPGPLVDHHFPHMTFSPANLAKRGEAPADSQHWHQDSTVDTRAAFDIQLMWFPHAVTAEMGGTRYLPGSHLRIVSEAAIGRYQNIVGQRQVVCPAGTLLVLHHGLWHGAGANRADHDRHMFKLRLNPQVRQRRLWNTADLPADMNRQRPIFYRRDARPDDDLHAVLCEPQPWFEADTERLEYINRARFWRHLTGDETFDADYWLTRLENQPERRVEAAS
ncbi:MAG: phytanoyl-CoA dioxygenase family protein [Caulobacteraceae bacterium]